jgi:putative thymidine phosphorylase
MKLKLKQINLGAGRPIAFINQEKARKIGAHINDRAEIRYGNKKIIAVLDIAKDIIGLDEISVSDEVISYLKPSKGALLDMTLAIQPLSNIYITKKLRGEVLTKEEINEIIKDIINNALTEAEISCFISAVYTKGMNLKETVYLTDAMAKTGKIIDWGSKIVVDKHCIGGIPGNRTTPLVVSICAAAGLKMPKSSSRAITSPAGTADTIETIAHVDLSLDKLKNVVKTTGACLAWGGSLGLAPADDKLIRIERVLNLDPEAQLIASILSKKIAAGSSHVLIDIPFGAGAKVTKSEGFRLKKKFEEIGKHFNLKINVVLTDGSEPIGNGIGPLLEIIDVLKVLKQDKNSPKDLETKSIFLSGIILEMSGKAKKGKGEEMAKEILFSGQAYKKFNEIISAQGKKEEPKLAKFSFDFLADSSFKIKFIDNLEINVIARMLGCPIDKASGIYLYHHVGEKVKKGEKLLTLYSESSKKLQEAVDYLKSQEVIK